MARALVRPQVNPIAATRLPLISARYKSGPYGYTQAKALVFSEPGEPAEALKYVYTTLRNYSEIPD